MLKNKFLFPLNLQMFAEDNGGVENPETNPQNPPTDTKETKETQPEVKSFTQEQVDNIIKGRLAKERKAWEKEMNEKQTEAEKLASMTEKEKKEYQDKKREDDLSKRELEIARRELTLEAKSKLTDKGISSELSDFLDYTDAEACNASIEKLEKIFQQAVEKRVDERLKGGKTLKKAPDNSDTQLEKDILKFMKGN